MRGYEHGRRNKRSKRYECCYITMKFFNISTDILHSLLYDLGRTLYEQCQNGLLIKLHPIITNKDDDLKKVIAHQ
jgi:hypothetical protein